MWKNVRILLQVIFLCIFMIGFLSSCSAQMSGRGIPANQEVLLIGSTKEQVIQLYSPTTGEKMGEYHFFKYHFTGYELSLDKRHVFVYGSKENQILVFDTTTGQNVNRYRIDGGVLRMLVDGDHWLLLMNDQQRILVINSSGELVEQDITLPFAVRDIQFSTDRNALYLIHAQSDQVSRWDVSQNKVVQTWETIPNPTTVWENVFLHELWIGGHGSLSQMQAGIARYSLNSGDYLGEIASGEMPIRFYANASYTALFVVSHGSNHLMKVDFNGQILAESETADNPYAVDGDGEFIYVASYDSKSVKVYRQDTLEEVFEFFVGIDPLWLKYRGGVDHK